MEEDSLLISVCDLVLFLNTQRCGQIEGWKRVKDASGKLQGSLPQTFMYVQI